MPKITHDDAVRIADKLQAQYKSGGSHRIAKIFYGGKKITQFGIRHDKTGGHDYVSDQIFMNKSDCITFGKCDITYQQWVDRMRAKGHIPTEPEPPTEPKRPRRKRHG